MIKENTLLNRIGYPVLGFGLLAILYFVCRKFFFVGFFNDDAYYIIGARALAQGKYVYLSRPGEPYLISYLPGYPLLLAPFVFLGSTQILCFQILSIAMTVGSVWLFWKGFLKNVSLHVAGPTLLLTALNHLTLRLSGSIMSDIPYTFFTLLFFILLRKFWDQKDTYVWVALSIVCAFTFYLRSTGVVLNLCLLAILIWNKRWKELFWSTLTIGLAGSYLLLKNHLETGIALSQGTEMLGSYEMFGYMENIVMKWRWNIPYYLKESFLTLLFPWPRWFSSELTSFLTIVLGLAVLICGFPPKTQLRDNINRIVLLHGIGVMLVLLFWHRQTQRYLLPLLPFFYLIFFNGVSRLSTRFHIPAHRWTWGVAGLALLCMSGPIYTVISGSLGKKTLFNSPPRETVEWIKNNTRETDVLSCLLDGQMYLLTGRKTIPLPHESQLRDLENSVDAIEANYLILTRSDIVLTANTDAGKDRFSRFTKILSESTIAEFAYENPSEKSRIYKIKQTGLTEPRIRDR